MKLRSAILIILCVIIIDQALKIWIKTHFTIGPVTNMLGLDWARLYFIENEGMAWGWKWGGEWGKMLLTLFRLAAVIFGSWYLVRIVKQEYSKGFIICASLIYAGALGNLGKQGAGNVQEGVKQGAGAVRDAVRGLLKR